MSDKNKKTVLIPKYDVESQLSFITSLCQDMEFDPKILLTLILADWIYQFQSDSLRENIYGSFSSFLTKAEATFKALREMAQNKVVKDFENEKK